MAVENCSCFRNALSNKICAKMTTTFTFRLLSLFVLSVFLTKFPRSSAAFLSIPNDTVALAGDRVTLECSTNNPATPLRWFYYNSSNPQRLNYLFDGRNLSKAFASTYEVEVNPGSGRYNLVIKSAEFTSAGEYSCAENSFNRNATVAFLTVIDPNPRWSIRSSEDNEPSMPCSSLDFRFSYFGYQTPSLQWNAGEKSQIQNETVLFGPKSTGRRLPSAAQFINLTMDLCEQWNDTNYNLICVWKTIRNPEDMDEETVTHTISLQQMQSKTIVALQCISVPVPSISHSSFSEQRSGSSTWQPVLITATLLSSVIVLLVLHIIFNRRSHLSMNSVDITTASVDMNTSSAAAVAEFPYEPQYENISNDTPPSSPLSSAGISSSAMSSRGQWNPVYNTAMETHRNARPGSTQVRDSRRSPEGQEDQRPSADRTLLNRMNPRSQSRGSDYLEIIA